MSSFDIEKITKNAAETVKKKPMVIIGVVGGGVLLWMLARPKTQDFVHLSGYPIPPKREGGAEGGGDFSGVLADFKAQNERSLEEVSFSFSNLLMQMQGQTDLRFATSEASNQQQIQEIQNAVLQANQTKVALPTMQAWAGGAPFIPQVTAPLWGAVMGGARSWAEVDAMDRAFAAAVTAQDRSPHAALQQAQAAFGAATTTAQREAARAAGVTARAAGATEEGAQAIWRALPTGG